MKRRLKRSIKKVDEKELLILEKIVKKELESVDGKAYQFNSLHSQNRPSSVGLIIEARTKPYVNIQTLKRSQLQIKSFFLKVSKHYEP